MTVFTVDVGDCVKPREQQPLLCRTAANIHPENQNAVLSNSSTDGFLYRGKKEFIRESCKGRLSVKPFRTELHLNRSRFKLIRY